MSELRECPITPLNLMAAALRIEDPDNEMLTGTAEEHAAILCAKAKELAAWNTRHQQETDELTTNREDVEPRSEPHDEPETDSAPPHCPTPDCVLGSDHPGDHLLFESVGDTR